MKKMILLTFLILLITGVVYGQDKVGVPIWNTGDKWKLTEDVTISVENADANSLCGEIFDCRWRIDFDFRKNPLLIDSTLWTETNEYPTKGETEDFSIFHWKSARVGKTNL